MAQKKKAQKTALVKSAPQAVATVQHEWPDTRIKLLRDTIAKDASPDEFALAMQVVKRTGLDPFTRQIYFISRQQNYQADDGTWHKKMVMSWQVSIDGFRLISKRTGKYRGMIGPFWCDDSGEWRDVWLKAGPPFAAKIGIMHADFSEPVYAVAKYSSYVVTDRAGTPQGLWKKMPDVMLAKCAESLARRTCFPQELSGLYTEDEMAQDGHGAPIELPKETNHRQKVLGEAPPVQDSAAEAAHAEAVIDSEQKGIPTSTMTGMNTAAEIGKQRAARLSKTPPEFREHCKAMGFNNKKIFEIMDANNDDPEALTAYALENSGQRQMEMPLQGEEGLPR